jgi:hypothetical protein
MLDACRPPLPVSRRGVVFFRAQDIAPEEQKLLTDKLGKLAGKPETSTLHIHPILNSERDTSHLALDAKGTTNKDDTISVISSKGRKAYYDSDTSGRKSGASEWHSGECI